jgi:hypothetical protein
MSDTASKAAEYGRKIGSSLRNGMEIMGKAMVAVAHPAIGTVLRDRYGDVWVVRGKDQLYRTGDAEVHIWAEVYSRGCVYLTEQTQEI